MFLTVEFGLNLTPTEGSGKVEEVVTVISGEENQDNSREQHTESVTKTCLQTSLSDIDEESEHETANIPKKFRLHIPKQKWSEVYMEKMLTVKSEDPKKEVSKIVRILKPEYTDIINQEFSKLNPQCVLKFHKKRMKAVEDDAKEGPFFICYAFCKRDECTAHYNFKIEARPVGDGSVPVDCK